MNTSRKFTYRNACWRCSVEFFPDRMECFWDLFGWGHEKAERIALRRELASQLTDFKGPSKQLKKAARLAGIYLVLSMFSYVLLPLPWRYSAGLFLVLFILAALQSACYLQTNNWIYIYKKDGTAIVGVQVTRWTEEERNEFHRFYSQWINMPSLVLSEDTQHTTTKG